MKHGVDGVIDCVGGALLGELIRCGASGGQAILYGGYSPERFGLHNFDLLMKGSAIKSYVYRYFFTPPQKEHAKLLREIVDISGRPEFRVPVGGLHPLEDFQSGRAVFFLVSRSTRFEKCTCSVDFLQFQNFRASNWSLAICTKACNLQNDYR